MNSRLNTIRDWNTSIRIIQIVGGWGASDRGWVYILYGSPDDIVCDLWIGSDFKSVEIWFYNQTAGNNLLPQIFSSRNPGQRQFIFANRQFMEKYSQIFSTEDG